MLLVLDLAVGLAVGWALGFLVCKARIGTRQAGARADARAIIEDANRAAETTRREAELEGKEAALRVKDEAEAEVRARRAEIARVEERLDNRDTALDKREGELDERRRRLSDAEEALRRKEEELKVKEAEQLRALEEVSGLTRDEAESRLFAGLEAELEDGLGRLVRDRTMEAEERADSEARRVISTTMERLASDLTSEATVKGIAP